MKDVFSYCLDELELSPAQSHYFQRVVLASIEVPSFEKAVVSGELSLSQARRIVPVITEENAQIWIEKAQKLPQRQLEKAVAEADPFVEPVARRIVFSHDLLELLEMAMDVESQRLKTSLTVKDVLTTALANLIEKNSALQKTKRAKTPKKAFPQESTRALPAAIKHAVVKRDAHRCTYLHENGKRCRSRRWLEIHHQKPLSQGGLTTPANLAMLCAAHHRHEHDPVQKRPPGPD